MDEDTLRRMRISTLEAKLELREIESDGLSREIKSPLTSRQRRVECVERRDDLQVEWPPSRQS